jgi:hypothetical protein
MNDIAKIIRLREALERIADPEVHDANWRAMRQEARDALEDTTEAPHVRVFVDGDA